MNEEQNKTTRQGEHANSAKTVPARKKGTGAVAQQKNYSAVLLVVMFISALVVGLYGPRTVRLIKQRNALTGAVLSELSATVHEVNHTDRGYWISVSEYEYRVFLYANAVKDGEKLANLSAGDSVVFQISESDLSRLAGEVAEEENYAIAHALRVNGVEIASVQDYNAFVNGVYRSSIAIGIFFSVGGLLMVLGGLFFFLLPKREISSHTPEKKKSRD